MLPRWVVTRTGHRKWKTWKTERQPTHTINNEQPTTRCHQQPATHDILYSQRSTTDTRQPTNTLSVYSLQREIWHSFTNKFNVRVTTRTTKVRYARVSGRFPREGVGFHRKLFRAEQGIPLIPVAAKQHFSCMPTVRIKCSIKLSSQNQFAFLHGDFLFKQVHFFGSKHLTVNYLK
jgi:hypothetical protein